MSAQRCFTPWNWPIGRPNWWRSRAQSAAVSTHQLAPPTASAAASTIPTASTCWSVTPGRSVVSVGVSPTVASAPVPSSGGAGSTVSDAAGASAQVPSPAPATTSDVAGGGAEGGAVGGGGDGGRPFDHEVGTGQAGHGSGPGGGQDRTRGHRSPQRLHHDGQLGEPEPLGGGAGEPAQPVELGPERRQLTGLAVTGGPGHARRAALRGEATHGFGQQLVFVADGQAHRVGPPSPRVPGSNGRVTLAAARTAICSGRPDRMSPSRKVDETRAAST